MRSRPDLAVAPGASAPSGVSPSAADTRSGPSGADDRVGRRCEVLLQSDLSPRRTVVSVVGLLSHSGGALLAAVLEYVRERNGGPVAVDLRGVSQADRHGLAPVMQSGAVLAGTSPAVDEVLAGGTRPSTDVDRRRERRHRPAAEFRRASPGQEAPATPRGAPTRPPPSSGSLIPRADGG